MVDLLREAITIGSSGDPIRGALLHEQLGRALWLVGDTEAALASYHAAMNMLPTDHPTPERAKVLAGMGQILMLVDRFAESLEFCDQAVAVAREVGDRGVEAHALNSRGPALAQLGRCREPRSEPGTRAIDRTRPPTLAGGHPRRTSPAATGRRRASSWPRRGDGHRCAARGRCSPRWRCSPAVEGSISRLP
jgi:tetratricopeptide (TPR) repeat protein